MKVIDQDRPSCVVHIRTWNEITTWTIGHETCLPEFSLIWRVEVVNQDSPLGSSPTIKLASTSEEVTEPRIPGMCPIYMGQDLVVVGSSARCLWGLIQVRLCCQDSS